MLHCGKKLLLECLKQAQDIIDIPKEAGKTLYIGTIFRQTL